MQASPAGSGLALEQLWVEPRFTGQGAGRALREHALALSRELGARGLIVVADPDAEGFYLRMGAVRVGERRADILGQERVLPVMSMRVERGADGPEGPPGPPARE